MSSRKKTVLNISVWLGALLLLFFDQLTKQLVLKNLAPNEVNPSGSSYKVWDGVFRLVFHKNTGAVWGILQDGTLFLAILSAVILVGVIILYTRISWDILRLRVLKIILAVVSAGAAGNMIDRFFRHYVVDFLYFELIDFPVFNVADCYITVSMVLLIVLFIFYFKEEDFDSLWPKKSRS